MIGIVLWSVAAGAVIAVAVAIILNDLSQFKERTIDEVPDFIRPEGEQITEMLFDPHADEGLRLTRVPANFRRKQRTRLDLAGKYYRSRNHRVQVVLQWGNTEWHDIHFYQTHDEYTEEALKNLQILRRKGKLFNRSVLLLRVKIGALRILMRLDRFRFLPTPGIAALRRMGSVDMVKLYLEVKEAAVVFARTYGEDISEELASLL